MASFPDTAGFDRAADIALLTRLQDQLLERVRSLLQGAREVVLLDYPNNSNVGDSLIWLGALALVRRLGLKVRYYSDCRNADMARLSELARDRRLAFLLNGGGNFGSLWVHHQHFRLDIFEAFPDNIIIQLPVSTHFDDPAGALAQRTREVLARRPNVQLLVRDRPSADEFRSRFGIEAWLVPDLAFMLGPLPRLPAQCPRIALLRSDKERRADQSLAVGADVPVVDWLDEDREERLWQRTIHLMGGVVRAFDGDHQLLGWLYERLSRARLRRGIALLSRGETVLTDRLHAHVLSVLLGIPNSIGDNSTGKVRALYDAWTHESATVTWCGAATAPAQSAPAASEFAAIRG
ncbi:polysaccharide pyruvyl transferase family protein [Derxia lacustris]|uniref:polysaccharide pyruvyl transferase family protein n=1 Tax=Derxia lacustris TaxID=764842 RepID=UPI000A16FF73|nr:polysaccharide pyruvyl transferase family protein [Derxia lacustris]